MNILNPDHSTRRLRSMNRTGSTTYDRTGATAVEFAFVFPVVLTFFIGIIALTQAFSIRDMAQLAAYEAAREGTLYDSTESDVMEKAEEVLKSMHLNDCTVVINPSSISKSTKEVEVIISVPMSSNAWASGSFLPTDWVIGSSVTLRKSDEQ